MWLQAGCWFCGGEPRGLPMPRAIQEHGHTAGQEDTNERVSLLTRLSGTADGSGRHRSPSSREPIWTRYQVSPVLSISISLLTAPGRGRRLWRFVTGRRVVRTECPGPDGGICRKIGPGTGLRGRGRKFGLPGESPAATPLIRAGVVQAPRTGLVLNPPYPVV